MYQDVCVKAFLEPEDLVNMGLFRNTGHVFRAVNSQTNVPPHVRLSKKNIRFPCDGFHKWLSQQTEGFIQQAQLGE